MEILLPQQKKGSCGKRIWKQKGKGRENILSTQNLFFPRKKKLATGEGNTFQGGISYMPRWLGGRLMKREYRRQIDAHGDFRV